MIADVARINCLYETARAEGLDAQDRYTKYFTCPYPDSDYEDGTDVYPSGGMSPECDD